MPRHPGLPGYAYFDAQRRRWVARFAYPCERCERRLWPKKDTPYFDPKRDALKAAAWASDWRRDWIRGHLAEHARHALAAAPTLWQMVRAYLSDKRRRGRVSWRIEASMCRRVFAAFGGARTRADRIGPRDVLRWRDDMAREGLAPRTINAYLALLAGLYHHAARLGAAVSPPTRGVGRLDERKDRPPLTLSDLQVRALFKTLPAYERRQGLSRRAPEVPLRGLILLAFYTLQRAGSVLRSRWEHVSLERRTLTFPATKNWRHLGPIVVPIDDPLLAYLRDRHPGPGAEGWIHANRDGRPFADVRKAWRLLIELTNARLRRARHDTLILIPGDFPFNHWRHTGASQLARSGQVSPQDVVEFMGDLSLATVERYYFHVGVDGIRADVRRARQHPALAAIDRAAGRL